MGTAHLESCLPRSFPLRRMSGPGWAGLQEVGWVLLHYAGKRGHKVCVQEDTDPSKEWLLYLWGKMLDTAGVGGRGRGSMFGQTLPTPLSPGTVTDRSPEAPVLFFPTSCTL